MGGTFKNFIILYQIHETYTNGYIIDSLDFLALSSVLSSIFVIISRNPISSVLFLITLFISIAGYLILLGLNFIGISYLLVYVGAVSILFLFILMLVRGLWMSVVQEVGILYNYSADGVHVFPSGSSEIMKRILKICLLNSELPN